MLPGDFDFCIRRLPTDTEKQRRDRRIIVRIALHTLHDPGQHPVDLSELLALSCANRHTVEGFLNACAADPAIYQSWPTSGMQSWIDELANAAPPEMGTSSC